MKKTTLKRLVESGLVRIHRGGFIAVHDKKPVGPIIEYLIKHFFARPNKNSKVPYSGNQEIFFGQVNSLPIQITTEHTFYEPIYTSLNLKCCDLEIYDQVAILIKKDGFALHKTNRASYDQSFISPDLGFAIRLVLLDEVAQDPAVTDGIHHPISKRRFALRSSIPDEASDNPPTGAETVKKVRRELPN